MRSIDFKKLGRLKESFAINETKSIGTTSYLKIVQDESENSHIYGLAYTLIEQNAWESWKRLLRHIDIFNPRNLKG